MIVASSIPEYRDGNGFIAEVIRTSRRKSADIRVEEGAVSIVVPTSTSIEKIDQLLLAKRLWIKEKMALQRDMAPASSKQFVSGEAFPYLGRNYRLKVETGPFTPVKLLQGRLVVQTPEGSQQPHMIRNALVRWYKRQASLKIREKVKRYAPIVGVEPAGVISKPSSPAGGAAPLRASWNLTGSSCLHPTAWWTTLLSTNFAI